MTSILYALMLAGGIALLGFGAELLVRGAVTIARAARLSAAVIGLTIVSMGTSLPELTVSVSATMRGASDLAIGNVVGSNIFNIGAVLGICALIQPMRVHSTAVRLEWPFMFMASFQLLLLARDGQLDRLEGGFFVAALAAFTAYVVMIGREVVTGEEAQDFAVEVGRLQMRTMGIAVALLIGGIALLVLGGELLVRGAVYLARTFGMTERLIGLTIVAAGTGAPELATSVIAARRGQSEMALGNVIGSNIFNALGIVGVSALVSPLTVSAAMLGTDMWWMLVLTVVLFPMMRTRAVVTRWEGGVLLLAYGAYLTLLAIKR